MRAYSTQNDVEATSKQQGFTLLEMVLVMFIVSILVAAIFGIVGSVTNLANSMTVEQQRDARVRGFIELCARTFRTLPPSAMVRLRNQQSGGRLATELTFGGATSPLSGEGSGVFVLECKEASDGYLQVSLREMNTAQAVAWQEKDTSAGVRILLLEKVASMDWRFFDEHSGEWTSLWNEKMRIPVPGAMDGQPPAKFTADTSALRPTLVELRLAFGSQSPQRYVFWVPSAEPLSL